MGIAHVVEIYGYLNLHIVGYAFIFLYARKQFDKLVLVGLDEQFSYHREHPLYPFGKGVNLLLCLQYGYLGGLHDS